MIIFETLAIVGGLVCLACWPIVLVASIFEVIK
jgi:hypothetical protein